MQALGAFFDALPADTDMAFVVLMHLAPEAQLEEEMDQTKEQLRATIKEYETTTEEMKTSNEELKTTNQELKAKIEALRRTNSDLQNLMKSTEIATLFLDRQLRIERFTPPVRTLFNIRATDTGRPLADFSQRFAYDQLIEDAQSVLDTLQPIEKEIEDEKGTWFLVRLRPYRTVDDKTDGVVLTFVDITALKAAQMEAEHEREYAVNIVETVWEPLLVLDQDLRVQSANDAFYEHFEVAPAATTGRLVYELGNNQWDIPELRRLLEEVLPEQDVVTDYDVAHDFEQLGHRIMRLNARQIDHKQLILLAIEDITKRKDAMEQLRQERNFVSRLLDTVGAVVAVMDADGRIVRFNKEAEAVSGYAPEEAEGQNVFDLLIPPEERTATRALIDRFEAGEEHNVHENHWVAQDGTRRLLRWSNTALRSAEGDLEYIIGTGIDITERRQMERELVAMSDAERRKIGQDLHDMLSTQLAGVAMMVRALASRARRGDAVPADDLQKVAELINESGAQARALSHSLMPLEIHGDRLVDGLQHLVDRQEKMTPGVACTFEAGDGFPRLDDEVAAHLYRIASEAMGNAVRHGDPDALTIRLDVEDDQLVLRVRDDGVGLPAEDADHDGMGLQTMQYRAELIGAKLDVVPAEAGGTVVQCRMPLERATEQPDADAAADANDAAEGPAAPS